MESMKKIQELSFFSPRCGCGISMCQKDCKLNNMLILVNQVCNQMNAGTFDDQQKIEMFAGIMVGLNCLIQSSIQRSHFRSPCSFEKNKTTIATLVSNFFSFYSPSSFSEKYMAKQCQTKFKESLSNNGYDNLLYLCAE